MVKTEKHTRASSNATLLGDNIQDIVKELDHILVEKSTKIVGYWKGWSSIKTTMYLYLAHGIIQLSLLSFVSLSNTKI
jgi:hypothetical protein